MQVLTNQVLEGCIVAEDIFSKTSKPIIPKKTVLNKHHLEVLKAFLITTINIEPTLVTGKAFRPNEAAEESNSEIQIKNDLIPRYLRAVKEYKELFIGWQSGAPIDIAKVRNIIIPLIERFMIKTDKIFTLHHYSTKKEYLFHHGVAVGILSAYLGTKAGYNKGDSIQLAIAGMLCDSGMAKVDPRLLNKPSSLTLEEFSEIKQHTTHSFNMVKKIPTLKEEAKLAILQHHERIDGSGYPLGLTLEKVLPFSKILAVADVYHAMISERLYRNKQSPFKVLEQMLQDSFGKFDINTIHALISGLAISIGTKVKLSNEYVGEIVFVEQKNPTRPMVKLTHSGEIIQLTKHRDIYILETL